jgi:hypothetical protein
VVTRARLDALLTIGVWATVALLAGFGGLAFAQLGGPSGLTRTGQFLTAPNGTAAGPAYTFAADGTIGLFRVAAGLLGISAPVGVSVEGVGNGQAFAVQTLTELTTIAAAATTDTAILMPAGALVLAVSVRVTVAIPTAATFTVGDSGSAARFNTGASVAVAANTTDQGTKAGAYYNAAALAVRLTPNLQPAANTGRVRVTIHYVAVTPPTS